jgi:peroxiredoxin
MTDDQGMLRHESWMKTLHHCWQWVVGVLLVIGHSPLVIAAPHPELGTHYSAPAGVGRELIGTRAPEWTASEWIGSDPRTLASLRGKVVLVRWWTAPQCPYCAASAEGLNELWEKYRDRGLTVLGFYHHKSKSPLTRAHVEAQAQRLGFKFPIAIDDDWKTLHRWWLDRAERGWTSVTFLIDREGIIRHIHPGGAFFPGEPGFAELEKAVRAAL